MFNSNILYLTNRNQHLIIGSNTSKLNRIKHEAPQGSVLGPPLCIIYTNDISHHASHVTTTILFAEDTTFTNTSSDIFDLLRLANRSNEIARNSITANFLQLNADFLETKIYFFWIQLLVSLMPHDS